MREHDISSGRVGTIENDSIPDGKRSINGIDIFLIVDLILLVALGISAGVFRVLRLGFGPSSHTSIPSASGLSDIRMIISNPVKQPLLTSHHSATTRIWLKGSE